MLLLAFAATNLGGKESAVRFTSEKQHSSHRCRFRRARSSFDDVYTHSIRSTAPPPPSHQRTPLFPLRRATAGPSDGEYKACSTLAGFPQTSERKKQKDRGDKKREKGEEGGSGGGGFDRGLRGGKCGATYAPCHPASPSSQ